MNEFIGQEIKGTWIIFRFWEQKPKTQVWNVLTEAGDILGEIKWFARWRKYAFFPEEETVYENVCLKDIANFIERLMEKRRKR